VDSWILTQRFKTGDLSLLLPLSTNVSISKFCQGKKITNNIILK
jgi:hypothetical protein